MSYNDDQLDCMRSLREMSPEAKCYCAWFPKGKCHTCPPHLSASDRIPLECPHCHNYPPASDLTQPITHKRRAQRKAAQ